MSSTTSSRGTSISIPSWASRSRPTAEAVGTLHHTLDLADKAAVALDARGSVVHANKRWMRLMAPLGEDLAIGRGGRLTARDRESDAAIRAALAGASRPDAGTGVGSITIARREGRPVIAKAIPVKSITYNLFAEAKLVLVVRDAGQARAVTAERIQEVLRITPAERRLLLACARARP